MTNVQFEHAWDRLWSWAVAAMLFAIVCVWALHTAAGTSEPRPVDVALGIAAGVAQDARETETVCERVMRALEGDGENASTLVEPIMRYGPNLTAGQIYDSALAIARNARQYDLRPELVIGVIVVESEFNPRARSSTGDHGLMQLHGRPVYAISENIRLGCEELAMWRRTCECDERGMLAHYNGGWRPPEVSWKYADRVLSIAQEVARRPL